MTDQPSEQLTGSEGTPEWEVLGIPENDKAEPLDAIVPDNNVWSEEK